MEKRHKGGEDAACMTENMLCVADGVGGWISSGIDPARYSKQLCKLIEDYTIKGDDETLNDPTRILIDSVSENREVGSCTCCIATLDRYDPKLFTANLGDSGYMLLRKSGIDLTTVFRSKEQ